MSGCRVKCLRATERSGVMVDTDKMADFAVQVDEDDCLPCQQEVWVDDEGSPFPYCYTHLLEATFILEQTAPALKDKDDA